MDTKQTTYLNVRSLLSTPVQSVDISPEKCCLIVFFHFLYILLWSYMLIFSHFVPIWDFVSQTFTIHSRAGKGGGYHWKFYFHLFKIRVLRNVFSKQFFLSDAEDNTSELLNSGGIADLLLLRTLLAICQKSQEPRFWEVKDSFVFLAYASLAASRTLLQWLVASLGFTLHSEDLV